MSDSRTGTAPTVLRMVLGKRLGALREKARVTRETAAGILDVTPLTVRRMENSEVGLKLPYVRLLLAAYGVADAEAEEFVELVKAANKPGWWHRYRDALPSWFSAYVSLEDEARLIRTYEPHYVPGLLQTEDYARAVLRAGAPRNPAELERRVALRAKRQQLLTKPDAPILWILMEEAVLRRPVGGVDVMRGQIDRLIEVVARPNVTLQIMPFSIGPHLGAFGPFHLFRFDLVDLPDIVYTENLTGAVYMDQRPDVAAYLEVLDNMSVRASGVDGTRDFLQGIRKEF
ncbi:helix-turn-helix domain-containing protein [Streptomyces liangshanensis]|uniref:Helix-turn-helix domain-containing protein n=1 Tax=Streptomyces liangshanensis TaxID=2717324 RepID=A0A6G9H2K1_9ACTN|nr:helix-turn-helix transcriptional regulator [Streptomyces liangshanensis]QIQ04762.1 helix-turn-helix domain-containing protein [Streptomyces liangshanensis]